MHYIEGIRFHARWEDGEQRELRELLHFAVAFFAWKRKFKHIQQQIFIKLHYIRQAGERMGLDMRRMGGIVIRLFGGGIAVAAILFFFCGGQEAIAAAAAMERAGWAGSGFMLGGQEDAMAEPTGLYGSYACLMDGDSGRVLYEKNGDTPVPMASTTKIMTCMLVLEHTEGDEVVTVSHYASTMPDVQLGITEGEQYYVKDLLYSLMLESHNDVAVALAEHVGGSVEGFAELMNQKAAELGLVQTHFVTPNGLDADEHYTTAVELCRIASWAVGSEDFLSVISQRSWSFSEITRGRGFTVNNKDRFLDIYKGALGVKTGFTGKAGYCFVGAAEQDGQTLVTAVLACGWPPNKNYKWADTTKLMDYGFRNFSYQELATGLGALPALPVTGGRSLSTAVEQQGGLGTLVSSEERLFALIRLPEGLTAPVQQGMEAGSVSYYAGGEYLGSLPVWTTGQVEALGFQDYLEAAWKGFLMEAAGKGN